MAPGSAQQVDVGQPALAGHHDLQREHRVLLGPLVRTLEALGPSRAAARRIREIERLAVERGGDDAHHRAERIGTFLRREVHHRQHDDDAADRRGRGAEAGIAEAHVGEHHPHAREQRRRVFRLETVDHGPREHRGVFLRQRQPSGQHRLQRLTHLAHVGQRPGAAGAPSDVRADGNLLADGELAVVKRLEAPPRRGAAERLHAVLASRSSRRSAWRARVRRDLTVPTATPSENAISS